MKYTHFNASALVILLALALSGCNESVADAAAVEETGTPLPVAVASPEFADIAATYATTASLAADAEAPIPARASGDVVEILAEEGDPVRKGQVLARLDGDRARLGMLQAKAEYEKNRRELERLRSLHEQGLISSAARDALAASVAASKAAYERAELDYEYTAIRATIDGVVSRRDVKIGRTLAAGEIAFVVTDITALIAYLDIPQTELDKFTVGNEATLRVDSHPDDRFAATIERISPTIDADNGTFRATLSIGNNDGSLAPGMFGHFSIAWRTEENALVIPASATVTEDNETVVYVVENGEAVRRSVQTGIRANGLVQVTAGLGADDSIVLSGQSRLRDGSRVLAKAIPATGRIRG